MKFLDDEQKSFLANGCEILFLIIVICMLIFIIYKVYRLKFIECVCENNNLVTEVVREDVVSEDNEVSQDINYVVDIKGAVNNPGVYTLSKDAIINDVINVAGGLKSNASTKYINLSKKITNEMVIYIYTNYEVSQMNNKPKEECNVVSYDTLPCKDSSTVVISSNDNTSGENNVSVSKKVSLNNATKEELMTLSGIGESKALAIIEYRNSNGGFKSIEEITNVSGIGASAFEKIKDDIEL